MVWQSKPPNAVKIPFTLVSKNASSKSFALSYAESVLLLSVSLHNLENDTTN